MHPRVYVRVYVREALERKTTDCQTLSLAVP